MVARLLSGVTHRPASAVIDYGHAHDLDVAIELPNSGLEGVASGTKFSDVLDRIAGHVLEHRTTLVFVDTRRGPPPRGRSLARQLGAEGGTATTSGAEVEAPALQVAAHHGSLSAARRRIVEQRLRAGDLRALVATASLELGIDVGPVGLRLQIGSPRAIGTFLQRVGRATTTSRAPRTKTSIR